MFETELTGRLFLILGTETMQKELPTFNVACLDPRSVPRCILFPACTIGKEGGLCGCLNITSYVISFLPSDVLFPSAGLRLPPEMLVLNFINFDDAVTLQADYLTQ